MPDKSDDIKSLFAHLGLNPNDYQELRRPAAPPPAAPTSPVPPPPAAAPPIPPPAGEDAPTRAVAPPDPRSRSWNLIQSATRAPSRVAQLPVGRTRAAPAPPSEPRLTRVAPAVQRPPDEAPPLIQTRIAPPTAAPAAPPVAPREPAPAAGLARAFQRLATPEPPPPLRAEGRLRLKLGPSGRVVGAARTENLHDVFSRLARPPRG